MDPSQSMGGGNAEPTRQLLDVVYAIAAEQKTPISSVQKNAYSDPGASTKPGAPLPVG